MRNLVAGIVCGLLMMARCAFADDDPQIGDKPLSELLKQLRSENRGFQIRAARALAEAPTNARPAIIEQVIPVLRSPRENDKFVGAQLLGEYGSVSRIAIPDLLPMLEGTQYERNRAASAKALGQILKDAAPTEETEKVTQALIARFNDQYPDVQREALTACGMIGPAAKSCIPHLGKKMMGVSDGRDAWFLMRESAAYCVTRMGPLAKEHVDLLISKLHQEGDYSPLWVQALGAVGPIQDNVIPNIMDKIESAGRPGDGGLLKVAAFEVLAKFGEKSAPAVPLMRRLLRDTGGDNSMQIKIAIVKALPGIGPAAKAAVPEVLSHIRLGQSRENEPKAYPDHMVLRDEAIKAYKALTGEEPPAPNKK